MLEIEQQRLHGNALSVRNRILRGYAVSLVFMIIIFQGFGIHGVIYYLIQSIVAISTLEFVNYIEHYGLVRKPLANGRFEKVTIQHSWNSSHALSNAFLFNLQRHSDHHANMNLPHTVLSHHESAPQLPMGYAGMILLALVPSVWFRVMDKRLDHWRLNQE